MDDLECADELAFELHRRFSEEFGEKECHPHGHRWIPLSSNHTCEPVYKRGAELAVELILESHKVISDCEPYKIPCY